MIDATEMTAGSATRDEVLTATASLAQFESEIVNLAGRARFARHVRRDPATLAGLTIVILLVAIAVLAPTIAPYGANEKVGAALSPPTLQHLFGTNVQGRDLFSRVVLGNGGQTSASHFHRS